MARRRKPKTLAGTSLYIDPRTGIYIWRCTDKRNGRRRLRSTRTRSLELARKVAERFRKEQENAENGVVTYDWRRPLKPLIPGWIAEMEGEVLEDTRKFRRRAVTRALKDLGLKVLADLTDIKRIEARLSGLKLPISTERRQYQQPLKMFSKWLCKSNRYIDRDLLGNWANIAPSKKEQAEKPPARRAIMPDEMARAFRAAAFLDRLHGRDHPLELVFKVFLITAPRSAALISRDVEHFDPKARRIDFGEGFSNKRRGAGALDLQTAAELEAYLGDRKTGPLFLSPTGARLNRFNILKDWREAFSLGLVDAFWPEGEKREKDVMWAVARSLLAGAVKASKGGNPKLMKKATRAAQAAKDARVAAVMKKLEEDWTQAMAGVDIHTFRKTHRTWAEASGVFPVLIDLQLGHAKQERGALSGFLAGSKTGNRFYRDPTSELFEVDQSAQAVRAMLDEAAGKLDLVKPSPLAYGLAYGDDEAQERAKPRMA